MPDGWGRRARLSVKRGLDVTVSLTAILVLSPLLGFVAGLVYVTMGAPVLFRQTRIGYKGKPFVLHKFRTMVDLRDESGNMLSDVERISRLGRLLRNTSIDELPELFDVVSGKMSLVGPRPFLAKYGDRYNSEQMRRHEAKPGITGLAQVRGRNAIGWDERFALDLRYVENWGLWLDVRILLETVWIVLRREGIDQSGDVTMEEFRGTGASRNG